MENAMGLGQLIIVASGVLLLFFGVIMYYSALKFFGCIVGGYAGFLTVLNLLKGGTYNETFVIMLTLLGIVIGAFLGSWFAIIFHHVVLFVAGAFISLVLFKIFAAGLVSPDALYSLSQDDFLKLIQPKTSIETIVMIVGGMIYIFSARILIVITMALVGAYLIAWGSKIYALFPILAPIGGIFQWIVTRGRRIVIIRK